MKPLKRNEANETYFGVDLSSQKDKTGHLLIHVTPQGDVKSLEADCGRPLA